MINSRLKVLLATFFLLWISGLSAQQDSTLGKAEKKKLSFKDPEDGALDLSQFLLEAHGVLPVLIPITEPAIGYGGGAALLYFHNRKKKYDTYVPPSVSGVAGLATENKTWGAGVFHRHIFGENRVRTMTAVFKPDVRINYFGNNNPVLEENPVSIRLDSWVVLQKVEARLGDSNFYAGASYSYFNTEVTFDTIPGRPIINEILKGLNTNSTISAIRPGVTYDSRNNAFTPTKGINAEVSVNYSAKWLGSSDDFTTLHTDFLAYLPISDRADGGIRFEAFQYFADNGPARNGIKCDFSIKVGVGRPGVEIGIPEACLNFLQHHPGIHTNTHRVFLEDRIVIPKIVDPDIRFKNSSHSPDPVLSENVPVEDSCPPGFVFCSQSCYP